MESVLIGLLAALGVRAIELFQAQARSGSLSIPLSLFGMGVLGVLVEHVWSRRMGQSLGGRSDLRASSRYDGFVDLVLSIHMPHRTGGFLAWWGRAWNAFCLAALTGFVGPEGGVVELLYGLGTAFRVGPSQWFEQKRRTEVGMVLSAGVSAAFFAPLAGLLLPIEWGVGGKALSGIVSALSASVFLGVLHSLQGGTGTEGLFGLGGEGVVGPWFLLPGSSSSTVSAVGGVVQEFVHLLGVWVGALLGALALSSFFLFLRRVFLRAFGSIPTLGSWVTVSLLLVLYWIYPQGFVPSAQLLGSWARQFPPLETVLFLILLQAFGVALVFSGFGAAGIFWPVFVMGAGIGKVSFMGISALVTPLFPSAMEAFSWGQGLGMPLGASAFFGAFFGLPLTGAVLTFEVFHSFSLLLPCFIAAFCAHRVARFFGFAPLFQALLKERGQGWEDGRSLEILQSLRVEKAMVTDFERVSESETLSRIQEKIQQSHYPFLPVVNSRQEYVGLLSVDRVIEMVEQEESSSGLPLGSLLEAKDLLYRSRAGGSFRFYLTRKSTLSDAQYLFHEVPCIPVLAEDRQIVGLLFVHGVRMAYDQEAIRRSIRKSE